MFQKKDIIYSDALGVCTVQDITKLTESRGQQLMYYVLRSVYQKTKVSYIPVEGHQVALRELITIEEATKKLEELKETDSLKSADEKLIGEIAWLLKVKPEELVPVEEE